MGGRGEVSDFQDVRNARHGSCCDLPGMGRKASRFISRLQTGPINAVYELSLGRCIRGISQVFGARGGRDKESSEEHIHADFWTLTLNKV